MGRRATPIPGLVPCQPSKFNQYLMDLSLVYGQPFHKLSRKSALIRAIPFEISWRQTDKETDKHR